MTLSTPSSLDRSGGAPRFNPETIPNLLAPGGALAGELDSYEDRPYQRELCLEVARLLEEGGRLAVEAPTGIGKSLGYSLPAAAWAMAGNGPAVVSTHTRALQQQLLYQEGPRLRRALGQELRVEVLKGRANYLCRRRYEVLCAEGGGEGTRALLHRLRPWTQDTETGDWAECGERNPRDLHFLAIRAGGDPRFCAHSGCTPADGCFFKRARTRAQSADLLVVNHALLAIHLFGGVDILPASEAWIVDEAHAFIRVALDHLTTSVGPGRIGAVLESDPSGGGFVPSRFRDGEGAARLAALHRSMAVLEGEARDYFSSKNGSRPSGDDRKRYADAAEFDNLCPRDPGTLLDALGTLSADIAVLATLEERAPTTSEVENAFFAGVKRFAEEVATLARDFASLREPDPSDTDRVVWKEWGRDAAFTLNASPLAIGPRLKNAVQEGPAALVFTSATLAAGKDFSYFSREVGLEGHIHSVAYPSPFDFPEQAFAVAVRSGPDPRDADWAASTADTLDALLRDPARKTMALFTSYRDLTKVNEFLAGPAEDAGYELLAQQPGSSAAALLERFRQAPRALLLGTASFWEGVDLPGDDLELLVLTRLPFGVPSEPRYLARAEALQQEGGNPFSGLYLPEAVLRFKQGFGRLIRRRSDRGIVAVLDPRMVQKSYGRAFRAALPTPWTVVGNGSELATRAAAWWSADKTADPAGP